jgi:hypothetical protein
MKFLLFKIVLLCLFSIYKFDIPVHCLKSQIVGEWEFKATKPLKKNIGELYQMTCGHANPSHESTALKFNMDEKEFTENFTVTLSDNDSSVIKRGSTEKVIFII